MNLRQLYFTFSLDNHLNLLLTITYENGSELTVIPIQNISYKTKYIQEHLLDFYNRLKSYSESIGILLLDRNIKDPTTELIYRWFIEGSLESIVLNTNEEEFRKML
jgi:hypothetical protein